MQRTAPQQATSRAMYCVGTLPSRERDAVPAAAFELCNCERCHCNAATTCERWHCERQRSDFVQFILELNTVNTVFTDVPRSGAE
eukprot:3429081-Prymnesium_polylepis.1